ncbi:hypothetical protein [Herbaspirillum huttiense]|uniref:DUF1653 domain-containing protein n=1 Tax=Herbaspirillum huttiense subsp. lycopersici TaxID=3074428 RepID=A0ABU2EG10_9BURK|nr:hypothetical protein [Herbaspirillum huttiense]MDR9847082.1 hypothetical protein [Herbaspirillum huttiense SE1]
MNQSAGLPKPYQEVFIWVNGVRRIARLNHAGTHYQLATFLADTKSQYLVNVADVERWMEIAEVEEPA